MIKEKIQQCLRICKLTTPETYEMGSEAADEKSSPSPPAMIPIIAILTCRRQITNYYQPAEDKMP